MKTIYITLLFAAIMAACKPEYPQSNVDATAQVVKLQELNATQEPIPLYASGVLTSKASMMLSFKIGGIVEKLYVEEGQTVTKGQLLATLNLVEINAQVSQSQQAVDKAQRDLNRAQNLYQDTVVTLEQVENSETAFEVARAGLRIARFNQNYARIVAPASGKILKRFVENHELVNPGSPILSLAGTGKNAFVIRIGVADRDIVKLQASDSAQVQFDAYPGESFSATVTELAEAADPLTGTFEVELTVLENKRILKNGFIGKVTLFPSLQEPYYRIAVNALVEGDQEWAKVFVPDSNSQTARPLLVQPDHIGEQYFTVLAAEWNDDPQVITDGSAYLKAGAPYIVNNP